MSEHKNITLVKNAIHQEKDPRHFMRLKQIDKTVTATWMGQEIARSTNAIRLQEAGMDLYDPVYYFPREDVKMDFLFASDHTTHCPLKGDTEYFNLISGSESLKNAAWSYVDVLDGAEELKDRVAFDQGKVQLIEHVNN